MAPIMKRAELRQDACRELIRCGQGNANQNVEQKVDEDKFPIEKRVLRKRLSSESRTPASRIDIIEISSTDSDKEESEVPKCSSCNCKIFVKKSRNNKEDHKEVIKKMSTSDADTDYYGYYDDDESEDSEMDMMKPRRSPKGRFAPPSRDVGESSRVAPARSEVEFRRRVLEIISEPYDMMEYMITKKEFDSKRHTDDHPELGIELMKWRDNRRKELALMRGFYFWRQNLTQEGAFKPWSDDVCLAVEPQPLSRGKESEN